MALVKYPDTLLQSLIDGCIALNRDSQKRFYTHFYGYACTVCRRYMGQSDDTIGTVNDGFFKILRDLPHFKAANDSLENSLKAWMRRIFINTAIDQLRKKKNTWQEWNDNSPEMATQTLPNDAPGQLSYKELLALIEKLSPAYRAVFNLHVIDGYSHEEIASLLQISIGTSKSNLSKARANLQKMILHEMQREDNYERKAV